jgi:hypothetical protein
MSNAVWVEVYRAKNVIEAHLFCDALNNEGVPAMVDGEWLSSGLNFFGWDTLPRILCPPEVEEKARALLQEFESRELHGDRNQPDDSWEDEAEKMPEE